MLNKIKYQLIFVYCIICNSNCVDLNIDKKSNGICILLYSLYQVIMSVNCELNNFCMLFFYFKILSIYSVEN